MRGLACLLVVGLLVAGCTAKPAPVTSPTADAGAPPTMDAAAPSSTASTTGVALGQMRVVFVDIGQGAAIIIQLPDVVILDDVGRNSVASADAIKAELQVLGVSTIDAMVITNPDADHAGGCDDIYAAYPVKALYHPGTPKDTLTWKQCLDAAAAEGTPVYTDDQLNPGDYLSLSKAATIRVLNINKDAADVNSGSLALRVDFGSVSWIFPGDIQCDEEDAIRARGYDVNVDLLQAAHHGSGTSTCASWLEATSPKAVFIPVGAGNSYGHPAPSTLDRITAAGAAVYRTDLQGTVTITSDGKTWSITTTKSALAQTTSSSSTAATPTTSSSSSSTTASNGATAVEISHIEYDPPGNDAGANLANEYVEFHNTGATTLGMTGWKLQDESSHVYTFPTFGLDAGAFVKVRTGSGGDTASDLYWGSGSAIWNNSGGDTASLYNGSTLVVSQHYN